MPSLRRPSVVCCVVAVLVAVQPLAAWWATGHQVIARIAAAHLTPAARTRVARILDVPDTPEAVADGLAQASTWADETKNQTHTGNWHFIDLTLEDQRSAMAERCPNDNCAPARIRIFSRELRSHQLDQRWSELDQLRYLVHFVGDIHQPLHTASDADQGGNCEALSTPIHQANNLHGLWDGGILAEMGVDATTLAASLQQQILAMNDVARDKLDDGTVNDWTWESHEIAVHDVYQKLHLPMEPAIFPRNCEAAPEAITSVRLMIAPSYLTEMEPVVREQLIKAGMRLARVLNDSL